MTTISKVEQELASLKAELKLKEQALEEQKQLEIAEIKAKREKGVKAAWNKVTQELVKADMVAAPDFESIATEGGKKRSETTFNKKCHNLIGSMLGLVQTDEDRIPGKKRKGLNDDQKNKIEQWFKEGLTVAQMNKKIYTNPTNASYQRVNNYVKKLKG